MLAIELHFLRGRFHATPWGRHVNEGVPEWPPSPFRMVRALYDAWKRKRSDWPAERVEPLFTALAGDNLRFHLPPARMSHLRLFYRQGGQNASDKQKVFDSFVVIDPRDAVVMGLPSATLDASQRRDLDELCSLLSYFGRAESLASIRVATADLPWNCVPAVRSEPARGLEIVRVACLVRPGEQAAFQVEPAMQTTRSGAALPAVTLGWLDSIAWGSDKVIERALSQPPALRFVAYRCAADALSAPSTPGLRATPTAEADTVVLAIDGKVRPRVIEAIRVGDELRRRSMGAHRRVMGGDPAKVSLRFSGKRADGRYLLNGHHHASFLAWDRDQDGVIDHAIVMSAGFDRTELRALQQLYPLEFPDPNHPSALVPVAIGPRSSLFANEASHTFLSATPFVPTRHYRAKRDGDHRDWLRREVARSLLQHGLPNPTSVERVDHHVLADGRRVRWLEFRRARKGNSPKLGYGFRLEFEASVPGPFSIGAGSHFGLGLFVPVRQDRGT